MANLRHSGGFLGTDYQRRFGQPRRRRRHWFLGLGHEHAYLDHHANSNWHCPYPAFGRGANALKDAAGNALNGGAGFSQALKILSGDFNDDGAVSASDMVIVNTAISAPYNIFADMNGDGVVNAADVQLCVAEPARICQTVTNSSNTGWEA